MNSQKRKRYLPKMKIKYGNYFGKIINIAKREIEVELMVDGKILTAFFDLQGRLIPLKDYIENATLENNGE